MSVAGILIHDVEGQRGSTWHRRPFALLLTWDSAEERAEFLALLQGRAPTANQDRSR